MEYIGENGFLEELLSLRSGEPLESMVPTEMSEFNNNNGWNYDYSTFGGNPFTASPKNVTFEDYCSLQIDPQILIDSSFGEYITPSDDAILSPQELTDNLYNIYTTSSLLIQSQEDSKLSGSCISPSVADHLLGPLTSIDVDDGEEIFANVLKNLENNMKQVGEPKVEKMDNVMQSSSTEGVVAATFNVDISNKSQKLNGQPSKNLMAERRRRKRLNDRLSMLRSVVPKISKMDKTSILGDTIDYIKELLQRINMLQEEMDHEGSSDQQDNLMNVFKDVKSNEILARNSPKVRLLSYN
ncbi:hypothetical protein Leryth_024437 [Lithospermum erythrorhizon]|nr:hypothetical protein Leryth_024437 [Lithospermum erythrorhizon]